MDTPNFDMDAVVNDLMAQDDGYRYDSPIPREEQLASKRRHYREMLTFKPLHAKIVIAMASIREQGMAILSGQDLDILFEELPRAGEAMQSLPIEKMSSPGGLAEVLSLPQSVMASLLKVGQYCFEMERFDRASAVFALMVILDHRSLDSWYCWGAAEMAAGEIAEAIRAYRAITELSPTAALPHFMLAECYLSRQDLIQAQDHFERGKQLMEDRNPSPEEEWMKISLRRDLEKVGSG